MSKTAEKIEWISFLQIFAIILVVIGHSFYKHENNILYEWIYSFHMPLFFFISGYLLKHSVYNSRKILGDYFTFQVLLKKANRLLLPYFLISSLVFFPKALFGNFAGRGVDLSLVGYFHMLFVPCDNVISIFWFLPTLFLVFSLAFFVGKISKFLSFKYNKEICLLSTFILTFIFPRYSLEILNYPGALSFAFYFALGYYVFGIQKFHKFMKEKFTNKGIICSVVLLIISFAFYFVPNLKWDSSFYVIVGILLSLILAKFYKESKRHFFKPFYGSSYTIYLFSWFFQVASQQVFLSLTGLHFLYGTFLAVLTGFFGPFFIFRFLKRLENNPLGNKLSQIFV